MRVFFSLLVLLLGISSQAQEATNPCVQGQSYHIVVLGSSTAAGTGPSNSSNAWVNRYRAYLQSINPSNILTNLARGGYNTYKIMPSAFVPPTGRPSVDSLRNITQALSLNPDAIIVNMPSNDAAIGIGAAEQMSNFISIAQEATNAGVPIWVCTTQPRNFGPSNVQIQLDARDSILSYFGNRAIDFWTGFADANNQIDSLFDSGDGVHMNDTAHFVLDQRVRAMQLLGSLLDTLTTTDIVAVQLEHAPIRCGSSVDSFRLQISNLGIQSTYQPVVRWTLSQSGIANVIQYDSLSSTVTTCIDSLYSKAYFNTTGGGQFDIKAHILTQGELNTQNDSLQLGFFRDPAIQLTTQNDTVCYGASVQLSGVGGDTLLWYSSQDSLIGYGNSLSIKALKQSETYRLRGVKGPFNFLNTVLAASSPNVNFNGIMFDLVAFDTLWVDSLSVRLPQTSKAQISAFYKNGSYKGAEANASLWTLWGTDSVSVDQVDTYANASFGARQLFPGDTLGIYLQMQAGANLSYQRSSVDVSFDMPELSLIAGTGVSHNFGQTYSPRLFSGQVYYRYGFNLLGQCYSDTLVEVHVLPNTLSLGGDTSIAIGTNAVYQLDPFFSNVQWSNGDNSLTLNLDSAFSQPGTYTLWVGAIDSNGCTQSDTIQLNRYTNFDLPDAALAKFKVYPNPTTQTFTIEWPLEEVGEAALFNAQRSYVQGLTFKKGQNHFQLNLPSGVYFIVIKDEKNRGLTRLLIQ